MTTIKDLPKGWANTSIGEVAAYQNGRAFKPSEWGTAGLPIIRIQNLNDSNASYNFSDKRHEEKFRVRDGDLLFAWSASLGAYIWRGHDAWLNQHTFRVDHTTMIDRLFLYYALTNITAELYAKAHGSGMVHVTKRRFEETPLRLPPLSEQRRIVAKIEELFSELDKGVESLKLAREKLRVYRQAVLKHAFEGKLTERWRVARVDKGFSASTIASKKCGEKDMDRLPGGWNYVCLSQFTQPDRPITYGVIKLGTHVKDGIPTLRSSDVRKLRIDLDSVKRISPKIAVQYQRTFLKGGEVLVTVRGTLGGVAVATEKQSGWNISREVAMIAPTDDLEPHYLQYYLASPQSEAWLKFRLRGVAYTGINLATLRELPVIYCPKEEQREITRQITQKLSFTDIVKRELAIQQKKLDALRQSILKKAFSGQLVPQNPSDEPASVLLERIRAQREKISKNNRSRKKKKRKTTA